LAVGMHYPILRYLKKVPGQGLLHEDKGNVLVFMYFDVDWIGPSNDIHYYVKLCLPWRKYYLMEKSEAKCSGLINC